MQHYLTERQGWATAWTHFVPLVCLADGHISADFSAGAAAPGKLPEKYYFQVFWNSQ